MDALERVITVWVITWRISWPLVITGAGLLLAATLPRIPRIADYLPPLRAVAVPLLAPLVLIAWSGVHWSTKEPDLPSTIHSALFVLCLLIAIAWPFLFRNSRGVELIVASGIVGFLYSVAAWFIGTMAISDSWL